MLYVCTRIARVEPPVPSQDRLTILSARLVELKAIPPRYKTSTQKPGLALFDHGPDLPIGVHQSDLICASEISHCETSRTVPASSTMLRCHFAEFSLPGNRTLTVAPGSRAILFPRRFPFQSLSWADVMYRFEIARCLIGQNEVTIRRAGGIQGEQC